MSPLLPSNDRERARLTRFTFLLHLRPVRVPAPALRWTHTYGLGGTCLVLLLLLAATGVLQMFVYQPAPDLAYDSVVALETATLFGPLVRGVHYWSANLLVVASLLHAARVLLTGGHLGTRRFTWVLGALLLLGVLAAALTGYLLPWDQLSYWAVTVTTGMLGYVPVAGEPLRRVVLGGDTVGSATLVNFYTLHTTVVPVGLLLAAAWHFWRVRRAGGVVVPPQDAAGGVAPVEPEKVMFWPQLMVRETAQALVVIALVVVLAAWLGAPLGERANPGMSPNPAKAPWYFLGFQELLVHLHPAFAVLVVPLLALAGLALLPYLTPDDTPGGRWFLSDRGRRATLGAAFAALLAVPPLVWLSDRAADGSAHWLARGVLPLALVAGAVAACWLLVRRRGGTTRAEAAQAVTALLVVAFAVLTAVGIWFRGPGMVLGWPWTGGGA